MHLHIERRGKGTPILVLHGLMSDHRQVEPLLPALEGYEAIMPDLIGCGKSDKTAASTIVKDNARELRELCRKEGIDTVIAYSISGLIALELQLPNTVFIGSFCSNPLTEGPLKPLHGKEQRIEQLLRKYEQQAERFVQNMQREPVPGAKEASVPCAIEYMHAAMDDCAQKAGTLQRALVVHGTADKVIDFRLGMHLAESCKAEFVAVPEGHFSVLQNGTVHQAISAFLAAALRDGR